MFLDSLLPAPLLATLLLCSITDLLPLLIDIDNVCFEETQTFTLVNSQVMAKIETICKMGVLRTITLHDCSDNGWVKCTHWGAQICDPDMDPIAPQSFGLAVVTRL
jgi:hypothetical protein